MGNSLFLATIKKNLHLRRTHHFFLASLAVRDLLVTIVVIPFVIDSQVRIKNSNTIKIMVMFLNT